MSKLNTLQKKLNKRKKLKKASMDARKRQLRKYKKTGKRGHKLLAAQKGREARVHEKAIKKLERKIKNEKAKPTRPRSGTGAWGGSKSIVQNEVMPIAKKRGITPTSAKRWETFGNPSSDHYMLNTTAFAKDFATTNNYTFAKAIFSKLTGRPGSEWGGDYSFFYISRAGRSFRVQIIAGTHGTGPHLHIGVRRV